MSGMKLRTHYLLLAFSIVAPVAIFSSVAFDLLLNAQRKVALSRVEESARSSALVVEAELKRAKSVLRVLANSHALESGDMERFYAEAKDANAGEDAWIVLYDRNGAQRINTRLSYGAGTLVRPDVDVLKRAIADGADVISGVKWGPALKNTLVAVEHPFHLGDGAPHVISQAYSPSYFSRVFSDRAIPADWRVGILDQNNTIIVRSHGSEKFVGRRSQAVVTEAIKAGDSGAFRHTTADGIESYDYFVRLPESRWTVVVSAPVKEVDQAVWRGVWVALAGLTIAIASALALAITSGRRLLRFVGRASAAAVALGSGKAAEVHLPVSPISEMEALNMALRDAAQRLADEMQSRAEAEQERNEALRLERTARAHAEQQNAAKDEFLAMLGHELRNPLSAIASAVAVLERGTPEARERAGAVLQRQTTHLRLLVDDLLEVNRALMGKLALHRQHIDLADVARQCVDTLQSGGRLNGCVIATRLAPAPVHADATRLAQVIDNVLDNAIKYSPMGGDIEVAVGVADGRAELEVRDHGSGISAELLPQVFNVFVQGQQNLQRAQGGLGIGLTLVRRLVEMHEGTIDISSAGVGKGATVRITLPLAARAVAVGSEAPQAVAAALPPGAPRVLLVEDNADAREMMSMLLELHGCDVRRAEDGLAGISLARSWLPQLAFIDIGLPGMDGYEVARTLRADAATRNLYLVALTGYGTDADRQRALDAGFDRHITKPLSREALEAALAALPRHPQA